MLMDINIKVNLASLEIFCRFGCKAVKLFKFGVI